MTVPKGALVSQVMPDSPAEKAGLQVSDVIIEFDGVEIVYSGDLPQTVGSVKPGSKIEAKILREGKNKRNAVAWPNLLLAVHGLLFFSLC